MKKKVFEATSFISLNFEDRAGSGKKLTIEPGDVVSIMSKSAYKQESLANRKRSVSSIRNRRAKKRSESSNSLRLKEL